VSDAAPFDARALVGLLADDDRRKVFAALVLGATSLDGILAATGFTAARAGKALTRLAASGLVVRADDGSLALHTEAFRTAAVAARPKEEPAPADESAALLQRFIRRGRLVSIPTQRSKRLVVLDHLAQEFDPGHRYSEQMVNEILGRWHPDTASLRRYLVDEGFLERERGEYWRAGGSVEV
jgi:hypothetical protein